MNVNYLNQNSKSVRWFCFAHVGNPYATHSAFITALIMKQAIYGVFPLLLLYNRYNYALYAVESHCIRGCVCSHDIIVRSNSSI